VNGREGHSSLTQLILHFKPVAA